MKILYLTDQTYIHGGIEKVLSQKTNYLADIMGDEVIIVTYNQRKNSPCYHFSEKIKFIHLEINYELGKKFLHRDNFNKIYLHVLRLREVLREVNPEVVISSSFGIDLYFIPFLQRHIPKIKEYHATRYFTSKGSGIKKIFFNLLTTFVERNYSQVVILNEDESKFYTSKNVSIIPNPAELNSAQAQLKTKRIIAAGRIIYQKNFEELIKVGQRLSKDFPDWEIHIYGDDYLGRKETLQKTINELSLEKIVMFKGTSSNLKKTFLDYSIYVLTSNYETFPMVLLESLSVGLPVVSYDCPTGPSRILTNNEDSFLIPYKNLDIFVEKLEILMDNQDLRIKMGEQALKNIQRFSIEKVMAEWKALFKKLIRKEK